MRILINMVLGFAASMIAGELLLKSEIDEKWDAMPGNRPDRYPDTKPFRDPDEYGFYSDRTPEPYFEPDIPDLM
jgi:hypothetical protein